MFGNYEFVATHSRSTKLKLQGPSLPVKMFQFPIFPIVPSSGPLVGQSAGSRQPPTVLGSYRTTTVVYRDDDDWYHGRAPVTGTVSWESDDSQLF